DVAVIDLPDGVDPGELSLNDPERLVAGVAGARPFLEFLVDRAIAGVDRSTAEGRARAAEKALAMVAEHPDPLVRDQYVMMVAGRCQFEPDLIRSMLRQGPRRSTGGNGSAGPPARLRVLKDNAELEALRLAAHRRDEIVQLLVPELFTDDLCATVYDLVTTYPTLREAIEHGGPEVAGLVQRLSVEESDADPSDVAARLWERYLQRQIERCRMSAREVDGDSYAQLVEDMRWLRLRLEDLRESDRRAGAVACLLAWVLEDSEEDS
ncbi:MAG: hypothetical protein OEY41_10340, partial [Acidimicrobiia bacterium]|nr:hypothetical protein [Acidimicrobiia bacterium]